MTVYFRFSWQMEILSLSLSLSLSLCDATTLTNGRFATHLLSSTHLALDRRLSEQLN
jgi:hypothetical protein